MSDTHEVRVPRYQYDRLQRDRAILLVAMMEIAGGVTREHPGSIASRAIRAVERGQEPRLASGNPELLTAGIALRRALADVSSGAWPSKEDFEIIERACRIYDGE